jgi:hypothetical protein
MPLSPEPFMQSRRTTQFRLWFSGSAILIVCMILAWSEGVATAQSAKKGLAQKRVAPAAPPEAWLRYDSWQGVPRTPLQPGEIDQLLDRERKTSKNKLSPATTDEQFLRRIRLDLTGQLPTVDEIEAFRADKDPAKRSTWVDKLQATEEYARHWARYWRHTVTAVEAPFGNAHEPAFEDWLFDQFKQNKSWGEIVRAKITATGSLKKSEKDQNGAVFFLGRHNGVDGDIDRAAETSRLFLGIQLQCAQCHNDRRMKLWKQVQFHELAGFFARMTVGGSSGELIKVGAKKLGEHKMPTKEPSQFFLTPPRFLDGKAPAPDTDDAARRQALADFLTAADNYWFSAAFVNRMWTELLGQGFFERIDDLSPKSAVVHPATLARLAAAFQGSGYDTKALIRGIVNSQAYQRQVRLGEAIDQHLNFTAVFPARLRSEVLWKDLDCVLGHMSDNLLQRKAFSAEFEFDPSLKADEVQGSIAQALWLLNNPLLNDRLKVQDLRTPLPNPPAQGKGSPKGKAKGAAGLVPPEPTYLKKLLAKHAGDDAGAVRRLYLHTLSRRPTERELESCLQFVQEAQKEPQTRNEAFEDLFRGLINTAEFQRRR